jgi:hypothetical protein
MCNKEVISMKMDVGGLLVFLGGLVVMSVPALAEHALWGIYTGPFPRWAAFVMMAGAILSLVGACITLVGLKKESRTKFTTDKSRSAR